jgi:transposase
VQVHINIDYKQLYYEERIKREAAEAEVLKMKLHLQKLSKMMFGPKSERYIGDPSQFALNLSEDTVAASTNLGSAKKVEYVSTPKHSKRSLEELGVYMQDLQRVYEVRKPDNIPADAVKIGEQQHEVLEFTRSRAYVRVIVTETYKVPDAHDNGIILTPAAISRPLAKCVAGPSVLAQVLVDKFCDHLPVDRQVQRFERDGLQIPYNTLLDWAGKSADLREVFMEPLKKNILASGYVNVDETGLKVLLGKESTNKNHKHVHGGFLWCYNSSRQKLVFFDYRPGRGEEHTHPILKDFKGVIQTDGWEVYKSVASKSQDIIHICCLAHARREFLESLDYDKERAGYALAKIKSVYDVERRCREENLIDDEIQKRRQEEAVPILDELHSWMEEQYKTLLPSSPVAKAIAYSLRRWDKLCYYTKDGRLSPDNNAVENSIRPAAIGRRNFMFAGSNRGAARIAIMYSLMGTCKMNKVNPLDWLTDVLGRINEHPINKIHELLPHNWIKDQASLAL